MQHYHPSSKLDTFDDDVIKREMAKRVANDELVTVNDMRSFINESLEKDVSRETARLSLKRIGYK